MIQVTIRYESTVIEGAGPHGRSRRDRYREAMLVWASKYGFLPGICARLAISQTTALGLVERINLRTRKERDVVYRIADAISRGVVRLEGDGTVTAHFDVTPLAKAPQADAPQPPRLGVVLPARAIEPPAASAAGAPTRPRPAPIALEDARA